MRIMNRQIIIWIVLCLCCNKLFGQDQHLMSSWQHKDLLSDSVFGVSSEKAYQKMSNHKNGQIVTVAVIDGGIDINHEDLKSHIWINPREIPANGKDDDGNGYIDDINGWNFMGSSKGSFHLDNIDLVRMLRQAQKKNKGALLALKLKADLDSINVPLTNSVLFFTKQRNALQLLCRKIGKHNPSIKDLQDYIYENEVDANTLIWAVNSLSADPDFYQHFEDNYQKYRNQAEFLTNINYNPRSGNSEYGKEKYGNSDCEGLEPSHGTHAAGVIAAVRENGIGMNGVADQVRIMVLRAVPDGDALDRDIASAIRYAADNGAKIINFSIGKHTSPDKVLVDAAVRYAMNRDVLIIHAAGNEGKVLQSKSWFPCREYLDGGNAEAWIEVGASSEKDNEHLLAPFSNYGENVDVMAPGTNIYSTYPKNKYAEESGTSMAAPMVTGIATMIRSAYPKLTAVQVKDIIVNSVKKVKHSVLNKEGESLLFTEVCGAAGVVNMAEAIRIAGKSE